MDVSIPSPKLPLWMWKHDFQPGFIRWLEQKISDLTSGGSNQRVIYKWWRCFEKNQSQDLFLIPYLLFIETKDMSFLALVLNMDLGFLSN